MKNIAALACVLAVGSSAAAAQAVARATTKPNVVMILMDDIGYGDIGSYGVTDAHTPNLDRLAREGVRLTDAYANAANCSPTRAGFITGRYQQRVGIEWPLGSFPDDSARGLAVTGRSLPALLKTNGYTTGLIGKWHLGFKPAFSPNAHGFDEFFGFVGGALDYYTHRRGDGTPDLYENATPVDVPGYLTDEITHRAIGFVDRHSSEPFFLEVAYNAVHWPFEPPDMPASMRHVPAASERGDFRLYQGPNDSVPATRRDYVRMLERADEGVGKILAALDRKRLTKTTLVIFTNDNGGEWLSRNAPLTNRKSTLWEGGIRVPLILRWPGHLPANKSSAQVAITMDLTASILGVTGTTVPVDYRPDGLNLLPTLGGRLPLVERQLFWRLKRSGQRAVRSGRWKLVEDGGNFYLFDVVADPGERHDLTAAHLDLVRRLNVALDAWERDVDATSQSDPRDQAVPVRRDTVEFSSGAHRLRGVVWRPTGTGPFPAVLFNHGSGRATYEMEMNAIGALYVAHGYVLFWPYRRGQGLSADRGEYMGDSVDRAVAAAGPEVRGRTMTELLATQQLDDALAALANLKHMPGVDSERIAVGGNSFGGILTVLLAQRAVGIRAAIASATAAQTWGVTPELRDRLLGAVRAAAAPIFFVQAANDYDLSPSRVLSAAMNEAGKPNQMKIYPAFGPTAAEGHAFGYLGGAIWGPDVFAYLDEQLKRR